MHAKLGDHKKALEFEIKVLEFRQRVLPADHSDIAIAQYNCGISYEITGNFPQAMECAREAVRIYEVTGHTGHPNLMLARQLIKVIINKQSIRNLLSIDTCPSIGSAWQIWFCRRCVCPLLNRVFIAKMRVQSLLSKKHSTQFHRMQKRPRAIKVVNRHKEWLAFYLRWKIKQRQKQSHQQPRGHEYVRAYQRWQRCLLL